MTDRMTDEQIEALCEDLPVIANLVQAKCSHTAGDMIRLALTAIRQLQQPWRGIDSAPKRGKYLIYQPECKAGGMVLPAWFCLNGEGGHIRETTHWMPLPTPPETER